MFNKNKYQVFNYKHYTETLRWHNAIENFDYNLAIDWAIELIQNDIETENVLIVASFSKPVEREEIKPYISRALKELNLVEKYEEYSIAANAHYYLDQILKDYCIRDNLFELHKLHLINTHDKRFVQFYLLYHAWEELEENGVNFYFEGADLDNIRIIIKKQAEYWIDKHIHNRKLEFEIEGVSEKETTKKSIWRSIKNLWKGK